MEAFKCYYGYSLECLIHFIDVYNMAGLETTKQIIDYHILFDIDPNCA